MFTSRISISTLAAGGLLAAGVVTAGALTATGAIAAGSSPSASSTPAPSSSGQPGRGPFAGARPGFGPMGGLPGVGRAGVLHGEYVVGKAGGGTETVLVQTGKITAVSGNDVTVKSTDGYTLTWTLGSSTTVRTGWNKGSVKDLAVGDTVSAEGTKAGSGAAARSVVERPAGARTGARAARPGWGGGPGRPGGTATPAPGGSSSGGLPGSSSGTA